MPPKRNPSTTATAAASAATSSTCSTAAVGLGVDVCVPTLATDRVGGAVGGGGGGRFMATSDRGAAAARGRTSGAHAALTLLAAAR
ncbi:hypothetical protein ATCC90586_011360 [Pythium insidiosum]|nr:hypothetical protein ATCC90586_011360 [Pythium insidiosum]